MNLVIQTRHVELDPDLRDLIEEQMAALARRYPEMLRARVTLGHGRHHRAGVEEVALVANLEGVTLRAHKEEAHPRSALRAAFAALEVELERYHRERRESAKRHGARPRGSIKRIFRDAGFGFIHDHPGRDVYFHRAALRGLRFEDLEPGFPVEFELEQGDEGPQASRVFPAGERPRA